MSDYVFLRILKMSLADLEIAPNPPDGLAVSRSWKRPKAISRTPQILKTRNRSTASRVRLNAWEFVPNDADTSSSKNSWISCRVHWIT